MAEPSSHMLIKIQKLMDGRFLVLIDKVGNGLNRTDVNDNEQMWIANFRSNVTDLVASEILTHFPTDPDED